MTITRRSLFAMFIVAPFAKLLPKTRGIGVVNGAGESKILKSYDGHPIVGVEFVPLRVSRDHGPFRVENVPVINGHAVIGRDAPLGSKAKLREIAAQKSSNIKRFSAKRRSAPMEVSWT